MSDNVHFSSESDEWETQPDLFSVLDEEFDFDLDVCATAENSKCADFFTVDDDGLGREWYGTCWMNPPYSQISEWMKKAVEQSRNDDVLVVCLIPSRTDTKWFHKYATRGHIRFLKGRLKFVGAQYSAPFPSAVVILGGGNTGVSFWDWKEKTYV